MSTIEERNEFERDIIGCVGIDNIKSKAVVSDGGKNAFYCIPVWVKDVDDLCEYLELDFFMGNILKSLWANKGKRHEATNELREAKKRVHYAQKELNKLEKEGL